MIEYYFVFEGVINIYEAAKNIYEDVENIYDALENNFLPIVLHPDTGLPHLTIE